MRKNRIEPQLPVPNVGDYVLIGTFGVTLPSDWFIAKVLWADRNDVLTEHAMPASRNICRQVLSIEQVRRVGPIGELMEYRESRRKAVAELAEKVREAERALHLARTAVYSGIEMKS